MWTEVEGSRLSRKLGRKYLVDKLREIGLSQLEAGKILDEIFREMGLALGSGEAVEAPFGSLKRLSKRRKATEPKQPYVVDLIVDEEGKRLLEGGEPTPWSGGWSLPPGTPLTKPVRYKRRRRRVIKRAQTDE